MQVCVHSKNPTSWSPRNTNTQFINGPLPYNRNVLALDVVDTNDDDEDVDVDVEEENEDDDVEEDDDVDASCVEIRTCFILKLDFVLFFRFFCVS